MLTQEENELLTRVGPGTPAGELLRRYWLPVAPACELTDEKPTLHARILGEDLVLFRDRTGRVGLLDDRCPHRGASVLYGRVEKRGIACAYHGWLFDTEGNCIECPAEPAGSKFHLTVKHKAYPVQKFVGLYWTYMGPKPLPLLPQYDLWVRKDGRRRVIVQPQLDCNWFQAMENSVDPSHLQILHQTMIGRGRTIASTTRGLTDDVEQFEFYEFPYGIMKKRRYINGRIDEHPLIFPNILRQSNATQIRVPMDDAHTKIFFVRFDPSEDGGVVEENGDLPVEYVNPYKNPPDALHPFTRFDMTIDVQCQDHMAWETQGPISDRTHERLATADRGIVMLREMMKREIEKVEKG
ncbi:MAG TPA: Rieske 2Fe-2S domain-containing protein, partial [Candidatus Binatia bacterium]